MSVNARAGRLADRLRPRASAVLRWLLLALVLLAARGGLNGYLEARTGLTQTVFEGVGDDRMVRVQRVDRTVDLSVLRAEPDLPQEDVTIRWDGFWRVPRSGLYSLHLGADDKVTVFIDGEVFHEETVDNPGVHARTGPLRAGYHSIGIEFEQYGGAADLWVLLAAPGGDAGPFDPDQLFPAAETPPRFQRVLEAIRSVTGAAVLIALAAMLVTFLEAALKLRPGS